MGDLGWLNGDVITEIGNYLDVQSYYHLFTTCRDLYELGDVSDFREFFEKNVLKHDAEIRPNILYTRTNHLSALVEWVFNVYFDKGGDVTHKRPTYTGYITADPPQWDRIEVTYDDRVKDTISFIPKLKSHGLIVNEQSPMLFFRQANTTRLTGHVHYWISPCKFLLGLVNFWGEFSVTDK